jgi:hypothetical protein
MAINQTFLAPTAQEKEAIRKALGLVYSPSFFGIVDRVDNLIMIHYNKENVYNLYEEDVDPSVIVKILKLRGVIIDSEKAQVVSVSFGYTPDANYDYLPEDNMRDTNNNDISFLLDEDSTLYYPSLEGTMIRAWKYEGKVYFSTHKKINPVNSSFGSSPRFLDLYKTLNGPTGDELFNPEISSSNITHCFMMCHKSLLVISKIEVGDGFLMYLGKLNNQNPDTVQGDIDISSYWGSNAFQVEVNDDNLGYPSGDKDNAQLFVPTLLTKNQVNQVLSYGPCFFAKERVDAAANQLSVLKTGEPVIAIKRNNYQNILSMCRIVPQCYTDKILVTDQNPITFNRACVINDITYLGDNEYNSLFPFLATPTNEQFLELKNLLGISNIFSPPSSFINNNPSQLKGNTDEAKDLRFRNALMIYILCLPLHLQQDACDFYAKIQERKELIYKFITNNWKVLFEVFVLKTVTPMNTELLRNRWYDKNAIMAKPTIALERLVTTAAKGTPQQQITFNKHLPNSVIFTNLRKLLLEESGLRTYQLSQAIINFTK